MQTTYALMEYVNHRHPDGWIQAGIGGAYDQELKLTEVYRIESEMLVGFGAQGQDGVIMDPFKMGWIDPDLTPYTDGKLICPYKPKWEIKEATGMTSFYSHGYEPDLTLLGSAMTGQVENMEGAPFFYVSLMKKIPFLSLRSISNYVEPRDTSRWKIKESIDNLNNEMITFLEAEDWNVDKIFQK